MRISDEDAGLEPVVNVQTSVDPPPVGFVWTTISRHCALVLVSAAGTEVNCGDAICVESNVNELVMLE